MGICERHSGGPVDTTVRVMQSCRGGGCPSMFVSKRACCSGRYIVFLGDMDGVIGVIGRARLLPSRMGVVMNDSRRGSGSVTGLNGNFRHKEVPLGNRARGVVAFYASATFTKYSFCSAGTSAFIVDSYGHVGATVSVSASLMRVTNQRQLTYGPFEGFLAFVCGIGGRSMSRSRFEGCLSSGICLARERISSGGSRASVRLEAGHVESYLQRRGVLRCRSSCAVCSGSSSEFIFGGLTCVDRRCTCRLRGCGCEGNVVIGGRLSRGSFSIARGRACNVCGRRLGRVIGGRAFISEVARCYRCGSGNLYFSLTTFALRRGCPRLGCCCSRLNNGEVGTLNCGRGRLGGRVDVERSSTGVHCGVNAIFRVNVRLAASEVGRLVGRICRGIKMGGGNGTASLRGLCNFGVRPYGVLLSSNDEGGKCGVVKMWVGGKYFS